MSGTTVEIQRFLLACVVLSSSSLSAQNVPSPPAQAEGQRGKAFDRLDRTSRGLIAAVGCAISAGRARAQGAFGPRDSLGSKGLCILSGGRALGAFFDADSAFSRVTRLSVVDLATGARHSGAVDTSALLAETRAARGGMLKGFDRFEAEGRQFAPFSFRSDGDTIEVWLLPTTMLMGAQPTSLGGERAFIYSPDGRTLVREVDASAKYRPLTIPASGAVELQSMEDDLPLVSELLVVNVLHRTGRAAAVVTRTHHAALAGREPNSFWLQTPRR